MKVKKNSKKAYTDLLKSVRDTVCHYDMIGKGDRLLVGVSGGADSVALILALKALGPALGIELVAANLDHRVRGRESAAESLFVRELIQDIGLECVSGKLKPLKNTSSGPSLEEKLRRARYNFFTRAARKTGCNVIATGHNMDDQAETMLMRVLKGSSADGLSGIPPVRSESGIRVVRPLIRTSRAEIISFLSAASREYVTDSSNYDTRFLRNRIRSEVLPYLEKINPGIKEALVNISDSVRDELSFSSAVRKEKVERIVGRSGPALSVGLKEYAGEVPALRREIFKTLFSGAGGNIKKLAYRHWVLTDLFACSTDKGGSLDLPGNVKVVKRKGVLSFVKKEKRKA